MLKWPLCVLYATLLILLPLLKAGAQPSCNDSLFFFNDTEGNPSFAMLIASVEHQGEMIDVVFTVAIATHTVIAAIRIGGPPLYVSEGFRGFPPTNKEARPHWQSKYEAAFAAACLRQTESRPPGAGFML